MFQLIQLQETVRIMPSEFGKPVVAAILDALNQKYPNKVPPATTNLCTNAHQACLRPHLGRGEAPHASR